jgi:hypothetical protein
MIRKVSRERCCLYAGCRHFGKLSHGNIVRHGFIKTRHGRRRRYRCLACGKTLSSNTGTPYHRLQTSRKAFDEVVHLSVEGVSKASIGRIIAVPESAQTPRYLDTGRFEAEGALIANFESALLLGPLSLQGEYVRSAMDSAAAGDPVFNGGYVQISWFITGEHRAYDPAQGKFVQTALKGNVFRGEGPGAWQLAARWSVLDLNDGEVNGGRLEDVTLGINWHLSSHCRLMLDGIHACLAETGDTLIATLRVQIDY